MSGAVPIINLPTPPGGHLYGSEAGLPQGSQPGQVATSSGWTFTIAAEDGIDDLTVAGYTAIRDGVFTAGGTDLPYGRISVTSFDAATGTVGVAFRLTSPIQSNPGTQGKYGDFRGFEVLLTDRDGDAARATLSVQIRDDEGVHVNNDSATAVAGATAAGNLVTSGTPDSFGADGFGRVSRIGSADRTAIDNTADTDGRYSLQGQYGVLSVSPTGDYSYAARADAPGGAVDRFTYWATDGDGDEAAATISFTLQGGAPPPSGGSGQVYTSPGPGSTVTAGSGDDTINASQGSDVLTGGAGSDVFAWAREPWSPATVTDFAVGADRLDLSALFQASGYTGADPVADRYITLTQQGADTLVLFDRDAAGAAQQWPNYIIKLQGVSNVTWSQLATGGGTTNPPPGGSQLAIRVVEPNHAEGNSGTVQFTFAVERAGSTSGTSTVNWAVAGSGSNPADAADFGGGLPSGVLTFAAGETYKTVVFTAAGDTTVEPDEGFTVSLSGASGATVTTASASGSILNDDQPPGDGGAGRVITGTDTPSTLAGTAGADTITAGHSSDTITGGEGADLLVFRYLPWRGSTVTDFRVGTDRMDFGQLFRDAGYTGSDPEGDGYVSYRYEGGLQVYFDPDAAGSGQWPFLVTTLQGVPANTYDWADLSGGGGSGDPPPPPNDGGQVLTSDQYGDTLVGGAGADTLIAGQGPDQLTGGGGGDRFVYGDLPWNAGHITDFDPYVDKLDLSGLKQAYPNGTVQAVGNGEGDTIYYFDRDGPGGDWPFKIVTVDNLVPGSYGNADWLVY